MDRLASQTLTRAALALAILCGICLMIVDPGTAEFYILIVSVIVNCAVVFFGHMMDRRREKE